MEENKKHNTKKRYLIFIILLISIIGISVFINFYQWNLLTQIKKYEYYNTGDDSESSIRATIWRAQTFTPTIDHKIYYVKLKMFRINYPGTLTVSIKATDINGKPTGDDLTIGTIDANTFTASPGLWYQITFASQLHLSASTQYAIVVRAPYFDLPNEVRWRLDWSSPSYSGGATYTSADSGSSWSIDGSGDYMFEVWG